MDNYKAICFDLDGTVYRGNEVIPEAAVLIERLQGRGIEPYYVTNNSSLTAIQFQTKLLRMGIRTEPDHIMTSAIASAKYCKEHFDGASVMMIGEEGLEEALVSEGFQLTSQHPDVVVVGIDRSITYEKLAAASLAIRAGAVFSSDEWGSGVSDGEGTRPREWFVCEAVGIDNGSQCDLCRKTRAAYAAFHSTKRV